MMMRKLILFAFMQLVLWPIMCQSSLQQYTPSALLARGEMQLKAFNSLYTQTKIRDENGTEISLGQRQSFVNNQLRYLIGISNSSRINLGFEANVTTAWYGGEASSTLLSSFGPTLKLVPFKGIENFSVLSTFLFPVNGSQLENPRFINHNRNTWWTQFFYDHSINDKWNIFFELDVLYRFKKHESQRNFFRLPASAIISYFPNSKWSVYGLLQYSPAFGRLQGVENIEFGRISWFTQAGLGAKYLLGPRFEIEMSFADFLWSKRDGAGQVFNFGLRILR